LDWLEKSFGERDALMIRVEQAPEPAEFDRGTRQPGQSWLAENQTGRPQDFWSKHLPELQLAFANRCGYRAMWDDCGTVDHYLSCANHRHLAYEWNNYRYASGSINSGKKNLDERVLDPFEVADEWFEVIFPSFQLVLTDRVPATILEKAQFTLERLKLRNGPKVREARRRFYELYKAGKITIEGLRTFAPQVAKAVEQAQALGQALP
jgi:hypothetical protein